ncbi:putative porin [Cellvibrio sp. ARAG 10.3]|uniref:putative porin n=1 Tax=Cellvibrio sp. ARAG 10.3 TaxID=3451358 RepID=UPI003F47B9F8
MRSYLLGSAITLVLAAEVSTAQTYRSEVRLGYLDSENELFDSDRSAWMAGGSYYFSPVTATNHPLAEAAFLEKASSIDISYIRQDWKNSGQLQAFGSTYSYETSFDEKDMGVMVQAFIPDSMFYLAAGVTRSEERSRTISYYMEEGYINPDVETFTDRTNDTQWQGSIGLTPINGLLVWTSIYEDNEVDKRWDLNAKYVTEILGKTVNLESSYNSYEDDSTQSFAGDVYFGRTLSIGAGYVFGGGSDGYQIRARKFFTDKLSANAAFASTDDLDAYTLGLALRF